MKIIRNHKLWWLLLIVGTLIVSTVTSREMTPTGLIASMMGHLAFAIVAATLPLVVYWLLGRPLNTEQMMATISMGWLILAVANLSVL